MEETETQRLSTQQLGVTRAPGNGGREWVKEGNGIRWGEGAHVSKGGGGENQPGE